MPLDIFKVIITNIERKVFLPHSKIPTPYLTWRAQFLTEINKKNYIRFIQSN